MTSHIREEETDDVPTESGDMNEGDSWTDSGNDIESPNNSSDSSNSTHTKKMHAAGM
jgi:hypothetical protein